jgi:hypothetical protein
VLDSDSNLVQDLSFLSREIRVSVGLSKVILSLVGSVSVTKTSRYGICLFGLSYQSPKISNSNRINLNIF